MSVSTFEIESNENVEIIKIASVSNEKNTIFLAIRIRKVGEEWITEKISADNSWLFADFPLIGSEEFEFPVIFNSPLFNPSEPRDSVLLDDRDDEKRHLNKGIFEESVALYQQLLNCGSLNWENAYLLAKSGINPIKSTNLV